MKAFPRIAFGAAIALATLAAGAQVTFYEHEGFRGRALTATKAIENFERFGFNDRASSAIVAGGRWEVCSDARFGGECRVLRPGSYDSLNRMGLGNRISSVRPVKSGHPHPVVEAPPPLPAPTYEYRWRPEDKRYEATVLSARAVYGPEKQRCWVEQQNVTQNRSEPNVGGAIVGGILGGVLGHQIGGGRGNDLATGLGAVGGAAIGANAGRDNAPQTYTQDVQRCASVPGSAHPAYWDVTYTFKGVTHRAQYANNPGRTVTVNGRGEPRG